MLGLVAGLACLAAVAAAPPARARPRGRACRVPGVGQPLDQVWRPDMRAAIGYAAGRTGRHRLRGADRPHRFHGYRPDHVEWSASVVKAMLMVAYLDQPGVAEPGPDGYDTSLLAR